MCPCRVPSLLGRSHTAAAKDLLRFLVFFPKNGTAFFPIGPVSRWSVSCTQNYVAIFFFFIDLLISFRPSVEFLPAMAGGRVCSFFFVHGRCIIFGQPRLCHRSLAFHESHRTGVKKKQKTKNETKNARHFADLFYFQPIGFSDSFGVGPVSQCHHPSRSPCVPCVRCPFDESRNDFSNSRLEGVKPRAG